jgi:inhibitor of cysteine peptidase
MGSRKGALMAKHILRTVNNGSVVDARIGDSIVVILDENPTTGYRWEVVRGGGEVLSAPADEFNVAETAGTGAAGQRRLAFEVRASGESTISATLRRSWEPPGVDISRWCVSVNADS